MELFDQEKFVDGQNRLMDAIKKVEGSVKLGMTVEGSVHPQSLINVLMGMKWLACRCWWVGFSC